MDEKWLEEIAAFARQLREEALFDSEETASDHIEELIAEVRRLEKALDSAYESMGYMYDDDDDR